MMSLFRNELEMSNKKQVSNNQEIIKLQTTWEGKAWENQEIAVKVKKAVAWLRENPTANAEQAQKQFGLN